MFRVFISLILLTTFVTQTFADEVLWESGRSLFIKLTEQDKSKSGKTEPNQHPVTTLDQKNIAESLDLIRIWSKDYYEGEGAEKVFPFNITRQLAEQIEKGLEIAQPEQDIIFQLVKQKKGALGDSIPAYMTGRVFFLNNELNIILGEYDHAGDKLKEIVYGGTGTETVVYNFDRARRAKASKKFKENTIAVNGIRNHKIGKKIRKDWFIIDLAKTKKTLMAEKEIKRKSSDEYRSALEEAKLAKERREMRLEMARIRKEMENNKNSSTKSIEERLKNLTAIKEKGLISNEEYEKKRTEILNDI